MAASLEQVSDLLAREMAHALNDGEQLDLIAQLVGELQLVAASVRSGRCDPGGALALLVNASRQQRLLYRAGRGRVSAISNARRADFRSGSARLTESS